MSYTIHIDTKDSVKSIEELKKKVESLKKSLESMDKTSSSYSKTSKELANAQKKLANAQKSLADQASKTSSSMKDLNSNTEKVSSNLSKSTKSTKSATDNFKKMREEIRDLRSDFYGTKEGTEEYNRALSALGDKMQEFKDMQAAANASAADFGAVCGNLVGVANGVVGGISALSGAMQIFGMGNSEFLEKLESKSMAVIQVVQGLAAVEDALTKKLPLVKNVYEQLNAKLVENIKRRKEAKSLASAEASSVQELAATSRATDTATLATAGNTTALSANIVELEKYKVKLKELNKQLEENSKFTSKNTTQAAAQGIFNPNLGADIRNSQLKKEIAQTTTEMKSLEKAAASAAVQTKKLSGKFSTLRGSLNSAREGVKKLSVAIAANPLGTLITTVTLLLILLPKFKEILKEAFGDEIQDAIKRTNDNVARIKTTVEESIQGIETLAAIGAITAAEENTRLLEAQRKKYEELLEAQKEAQKVADKAQERYEKWNSKWSKAGTLGLGATVSWFGDFKKDAEDSAEELQKVNDELDKTKKSINQLGSIELRNLSSDEDKDEEKAAGSSFQAKIDALKSWLESFEDGLKTQAELLEKSHNEELKKLKESLNAGLLTQDQYNELKLQSDKRYFDKKRELMKSSNAELKKLLEELGSWESGQRSPMQEIIDEFNEGQDILDKALDKGEISYEDYLKAMERLSARYAKKLRAALFDKVSDDVDNLNRKLQGKSSKVASNYDVEISNAESHGKIVDAVQLRIDKENELFRIEQEGIHKEIEMWQQAADSCKEGSDEQVEALEKIAEAQERLNQSTNKHTIATNDNEQAMADAKIGYRSFNDALKDSLGLTAEHANALEMATNMAGDLMNELGNTIGAFADEALAQSENEELTEEAREKAFQQYKNLQIAQTTINFMAGLMATWKSAAEMKPPASWIYGGAMTAMQSAQYALSIKAIRRQSMESPSTESGAGSSSFNIASPTYTTAEANIQAARPASDTKVYVLESDISNAQAKNKVRVNDTTF